MTAASAGVRWTVRKDTSSGRDMRTYVCRPCDKWVDVDNGTSIWAGAARHAEGRVSEVGRGSVPVQRGSSPGLTVPQLAANSAGAYRAKQPHKYVLTSEDQRHPHFGGERWRVDGCRPS